MNFDDEALDTSQVEDRRSFGGLPGGGLAAGGGLGVIGLIALLVTQLLGGGGGGPAYDVNSGLQSFPDSAQGTGSAPLQAGAADDTTRFVTHVVNNVQQAWATQFRASGKTYSPTRLVLYSATTRSGCGAASSSTGPFYCPADRKVYLDLGFFRELRSRYGAPGDFAQAYVVAHEFGHHVQTLLGVDDQVRTAQQEQPDLRNELSVRLELQADCFAGVWAHSAYEQGRLEPGDLQEGLSAAAAVGDDRLQRQATGYVDPDSFTHGSSAQRQRWFTTGYESGAPGSCDTFRGDG